MFPKKFLVSLLSIKDLKAGDVTPVDVVMYVDKDNLEKLIEAGYNPRKISFSVYYNYPKTFPGDKKLYFSILWQDIIKGRFFNSSRYLAYCMIKKDIYKQTLSQKEIDAYNMAFNIKDVEEDEIIHQETTTHTSKKIIAFTSSAPKIGKTTTVEKLMDVFENEGYITEKHTIAEMIRVCLSVIAGLLEIDSSRFFDNYHEKDISKTYGNELVPFKTRDLLCDFSIMMQKYYGTEVWGKTAANFLLQSDANVIFIDDLRRKDELSILKETFGDDLIVISLDKIDVDSASVQTELSEAARQFESKISRENVDHFFTFNEDWSNTPELITLVRSLI